jgi:tetratricopeptide (TPR) repeat protein
MSKTVSLALAMALACSSGPLEANDEASLELGIRQVNEGDLSNAVVTLDVVIQQLASKPAADLSELKQAYLYKGIALVGLLQEEPAKAAFFEALKIDPKLKLKKGEQPDRVVRVFDAVREGKSWSVIQRPSGAPKRAGLGAGAIAAIVRFDIGRGNSWDGAHLSRFAERNASPFAGPLLARQASIEPVSNH